MAKSDHLAKLKNGVRAWNVWRERNPGIQPDLVAADLRDAKLRGADLRGAGLIGADLRQADLRDARLQRADLRGAELLDANLKRTNLAEADLADADLQRADLRRANLQRAHLQRASLQYAHLQHTDLQDTALDTDFTGADFESAVVAGVDFRASILHKAKNLRLDGNRVKDVRFSTHAQDSWSVLRRGYTGSRMLFHLIFLIAFLVPFTAETFWWLGINRSQGLVLQTVPELQQLALEMEGDLPGQSEAAKKLARRLGAVSPCLAPECEEFRVWELLVGKNQGVQWILVLVLLVYNGIRAWLTYRLGPMRDDVEISGWIPLWKEYRSLFFGHRVAQTLIWLAGAAFVVNAYIWLFDTSVWLPAG